MRIVVTGASGFIGSALCRRLGTARHEVIAVERSSGTPMEVQPGVTVRSADLLSRDGWDAVVEGADAVVHLGGLAHRGGVSAEELRRVNVTGTRHVAEAAARAGARFLFLSTAKVYGDATDRVPFDHSSPAAPGDAYALAKVAAEEALRAIAGLHWLVLRPPLVYGPGVKANFLRLMRAIASGLPLPLARVSNRRSLIGLDNLCDAIEHGIRSHAGDGGCFPVCDGAAVSTPQLCDEIAAMLGRHARLFPFPVALLERLVPVHGLTRSLEVDDRAFRERFAWSPPLTRDAGLQSTVRWFLARESRGG